ncbi:MAG: carboxypeptidase regulatory-like domain-containing protein [Acidobacteriaceae bacterium]|jgi:Flp pilus assembly protein TadD|nr:carboxypeptidase regulatory-like domain-containing protein [Acidobacteriaceae bacterium]
MGRLFPILSVALLVALCASVADAQNGRVSGVVKSDDGQPLKGVTIVADNEDSGLTYTSTTDDKGRFTLLGLRAGLWKFAAAAPGFSTEGGSLTVRTGAPNPPLTFVLKRTGETQFGALGGLTNRDIQAGLDTADRLMAQQKWDQAIEAYQSLADKSPALSFVKLQIAAAHRQKKEYDAALTAYNAVLVSDPGNAQAYLGIAETYQAKGDTSKAEEGLTAAATGPHASREIFFALAELKEAQHAADAAAWYRKAADADPSWGKPRYKLGLAAMEQGNSADATRLLTEAIAVDPASPEAALAKSSLESLKK